MTTSPNTLQSPNDLDDLLNYRLWQLLAASGNPVVRLLEGHFGITRREWRLIGVLAAQPALSPSALADAAHLDRGRTSKAIGALRRKRLIERMPASGDRRRAEVVLTTEGRALYDQAFPQIAALNAAIMDALSDDEASDFDLALTRLLARARALEQSVAPGLQANRRQGGSRQAFRDADDTADT